MPDQSKPDPSNMTRLEGLVAKLPEAQRVNVEAWGDHPTFRVRGKNFVFSNDTATSLSVKLTHDEAAAVVATDPRACQAGYGLGRHGWIALDIADPMDVTAWAEIAEWVVISYGLVAPKTLARQVPDDLV